MVSRKWFGARGKETAAQRTSGLFPPVRCYLRVLTTLIVLLFTGTSHATYNTNLIGTVAAIMTYTSGGSAVRIEQSAELKRNLQCSILRTRSPHLSGKRCSE